MCASRPGGTASMLRPGEGGLYPPVHGVPGGQSDTAAVCRQQAGGGVCTHRYMVYQAASRTQRLCAVSRPGEGSVLTGTWCTRRPVGHSGCVPSAGRGRGSVLTGTWCTRRPVGHSGCVPSAGRGRGLYSPVHGVPGGQSDTAAVCRQQAGGGGLYSPVHGVPGGQSDTAAVCRQQAAPPGEQADQLGGEVRLLQLVVQTGGQRRLQQGHRRRVQHGTAHRRQRLRQQRTGRRADRLA